jgi:hypothetical protein
VGVHIDPIYDEREFYQLTPERQPPLGFTRMNVLPGIIVTVLIGDFVSGFFHWLEDAYGREDWPITGRLITKYNILHHHDPRHFTRNSWLESSWIMLCIIGLIVLAAWALGVLTWQVWLFAALGVNINQIHKWAHRTPAENGRLITVCHRLHLLQTPRHHAGHHTDPKNSHYCVLTNFLNPVLDWIRFWQGLEWVIWKLFRVRRREDASVGTSRMTRSVHQPKACDGSGSLDELRSKEKAFVLDSIGRFGFALACCVCLSGCLFLDGKQLSKPVAPSHEVELRLPYFDIWTYYGRFGLRDFDLEVGVPNVKDRWEVWFCFYLLPIPYRVGTDSDESVPYRVEEDSDKGSLTVHMKITPRTGTIILDPSRIYHTGTNGSRLAPSKVWEGDGVSSFAKNPIDTSNTVTVSTPKFFVLEYIVSSDPRRPFEILIDGITISNQVVKVPPIHFKSARIAKPVFRLPY